MQLWKYWSLIFLLTTSLLGQDIDVSPPLVLNLDGPPGTNITVPIEITISSAQVSVGSYSLHFLYPTSVLDFIATDNTDTATEGWFSSTGQENSAGDITIGGFDTENAVTGVGTETLINVIFEIVGAGTGALQLRTFADDISNATTTDGTVNSSLPVELVSFHARVSGAGVTLQWLTASESDNFGFEVEKSADARQFEKIGFVPGHGTTTLEQSYEFSDAGVSPGTYYYRLKQIDTGGAFEYSDVIEVIAGAPRTFSVAQNYPNPFNPETSIRFTVPQSSRVKISIFNQRGRLIRRLVDAVYGAGGHDATWDARDHAGRDVASGIYLYKIQSGDFSQVRKMTLLR